MDQLVRPKQVALVARLADDARVVLVCQQVDAAHLQCSKALCLCETLSICKVGRVHNGLADWHLDPLLCTCTPSQITTSAQAHTGSLGLTGRLVLERSSCIILHQVRKLPNMASTSSFTAAMACTVGKLQRQLPLWQLLL